MGKMLPQRWEGSDGGASRRDRMPCDFEAYLPDPLAGRNLLFGNEVVAEIAEAQDALTRLDQSSTVLASTEALARMLLRAESVASSRIEGLEVSARKLLRAEIAHQDAGEPANSTAMEVLNNINAMSHGVHSVGPGDAITLQTVLQIHARLLNKTQLHEHAGQLRTQQNWIGGSAYTPYGAAFVPPPHSYVPALMEDLCAFCNRDDLAAIVQAAVAHAQFEKIHPFVDGNGRTGRALIHLILRRRNITRRVLAPISIVLATHARGYIHHLNQVAFLGEPDGAEAQQAFGEWTEFFAGACVRAVRNATQFEQDTARIELSWRAALGTVRKNSATDLLLGKLLSAPVITVSMASLLINRSFPQTNEAIARLAAAKILKQVSIGKRNRAYEAPAVIDAFTRLERGLASPTGDTLTAPPSRRVPARKK